MDQERLKKLKELLEEDPQVQDELQRYKQRTGDLPTVVIHGEGDHYIYIPTVWEVQNRNGQNVIVTSTGEVALQFNELEAGSVIVIGTTITDSSSTVTISTAPPGGQWSTLTVLPGSYQGPPSVPVSSREWKANILSWLRGRERFKRIRNRNRKGRIW